ncbi:MAG: NAD(P)-dependent glycerol-3-phosphate dehydrogenase [Rickettsiales bacterium]|nr:NAD(P)-dependent glycerol-3-phosphate dehydrogenase [Rickettsiales bacterium]
MSESDDQFLANDTTFQSSSRTRVGVIGAGSWGTALAVIANRAGSDVTLWSRNEQVVEVIRDKRINEIYLPDIFIDPAIRITTHLPQVCDNDLIIVSVPSQSLRTLCINLSDLTVPELPIMITTKGIERGSLLLMHEVVNSILPANPLAVLSGPNFAREAALALPTATAIACHDKALGEHLRFAIGGKWFRPYLSNDLIGTEIGGAVKNVIALACGIAAGRKYGENARAALITRGLAEMTRLAIVKGGRAETLMGLAGIGDLVLTCSSMQSRNLSLGYALGQGRELHEVLPGKAHGLTEGVVTADSLYELSMKLGVAMPLCSTVHHILKGRLSIDEGIDGLLSRPFTEESPTCAI